MRSMRRSIVLSEAQPFNALLNAVLRTSASCPKPAELIPERSSADLMQTLVDLYGQQRDGAETRFILKFSSWGTFGISWARSLWPEVPCALVIRDPLEVLVSNLTAPSDWLTRKSISSEEFPMLDWKRSDAKRMSNEEYCARILGSLCESSIETIDDRIMVIDYSELDMDGLIKIAQHFHLHAVGAETRFRRVLDTYSKDRAGARAFRPDADDKRRRVTEAIKAAAEKWAIPRYDRLRGLQKSEVSLAGWVS